MSSGITLLPQSPLDSAQLPSNPCYKSLSSSYTKQMWRTSVKRALRPYPSPSSTSFCSSISNFIESSFSSKKDWILDFRASYNGGHVVFSKLNFYRPSQVSGCLLGKGPCHEFFSASGFKGIASIAEAVESVSSTDVDEETSFTQESHDFLQEISSRDDPIGTSAGYLGKIPQHKHHLSNPCEGIGSAKHRKLRSKQLKIETEAWTQAAQEYNDLLMDMCERKLAPTLPYMKSLFLGWFEPFRDRISAEQELCKKTHYKPAYAPYFIELPSDMMAVIVMHKLMGLLMTGIGDGTVRVVQASCLIGEAIEQEARIYKFLLKSKKRIGNNLKDQDNSDDPVAKEEAHLRKKVKNLMKRQKLPQLWSIVKAKDSMKPWGSDNHAKVGSRLIELLIDSAYIQPPIDHHIDGPPDIRPAFRHTLKIVVKDAKRVSRYGAIECDSLIYQGLEKTARHMVIQYMPMLIPPVKWTGYDKGGHLFLPSYIMRTHGARKQREAIKKTPKSQMQPVFEALNTLGATKWRINKRILGVVDRIWSGGGGLADLVNCEDVPLPEKPETEDENEIKEWKWKLRTIKKENSERHSHRCDVELKLAVARKMKDEDGFYYPHSLDFRGRAYPMHPHLNHLGSDLCRGVLEFAEGRPLGKSGLRWLKIHLANLYGNGVDKKSHEDRTSFTESHLDDIFDSADRPLEGGRWWLTAEDPFQFLAVCIKVAEALRSSSPETTISHIPVHQDGSCNGLQHYAALGRDKLGAVAVNLVAGDQPSDVYSSIAARVLEILQRDAQKDIAIDPNVAHARLLIGQVDRKLVKQTVMTSVYGVTYIGARQQIAKRLKERNAITDKSELFHASSYAARTTLIALEEMFQAARSIMNWLSDCAKLIALKNETVRWVTPLGLPVVQPYNKLGRHLVKTSLQVLSLKRDTDKVMLKRQRTAFPPNFIHSLDGSHMMMTAVACRDAGLNFAGVHDSYWTHASDVDKLNEILREKFVELYEQPILENLLKSFQKSFPTVSFPELPSRGDFDVKDVLNSPYFFN